MPTKMIFRDKVSENSPEMVKINQIRRYWKKIVGVKKSFEHNNPLLLAWKQALPEHSMENDLREHLTMDLWQRVVSKMKPWKAPNPDGLQSYWWKSFKTALLPQDWISNGRIILLFKSGSRSDPANYRPIACFNTCYKLLTGYVTAYLRV
jgi:hypothetical protein